MSLVKLTNLLILVRLFLDKLMSSKFNKFQNPFKILIINSILLMIVYDYYTNIKFIEYILEWMVIKGAIDSMKYP